MLFENGMHRQELVFDCHFQSESGTESCLSHLAHVPTQLGICTALNPPLLSDVYKESEFVTSFGRLFNTPEYDFASLLRKDLPFQGSMTLNVFEKRLQLAVRSKRDAVELESSSLSLEPGFLYDMMLHNTGQETMTPFRVS